MLFAAHSGTRFLVLAAGLVVVAWAAAGHFGKRRYSPGVAKAAGTFAGLLHLQTLLGAATLFARPFYTQLLGHVFMMVAAAVVAQATASVVKRRPPEARSYGPHLVGAALALLFVALGILAIGRGVFESTVAVPHDMTQTP